MDTITPNPAHGSGVQAASTGYRYQNDDPWAKRYSLTFDGGGVRGYSSLLILGKLMEFVEEIEKGHEYPATHSYYPVETPMNDHTTGGDQSTERQDSNLYLPCHYFDFIAGTSTGGLVAIMLARLRMSVGEAQKVFTDMSKTVFSGARAPVWFPGIYRYNHRKLEKVVKSVVDGRIPTSDPNWSTKEKSFFSELNGICNCIVIAYGETKQINTPYLFRSYMSPRLEYPFKRKLENISVRNAGSRDHYPIWMVARATSAAPGYLRKVKIEGRLFVDGGLGCNNPSLELYQEIKFLYGRAANSLILSIGTGIKTPPSIFGNNINILSYALKMATDSEKTHDTMKTLSDADGFFYQRLNVQEGLGHIKLGAYQDLPEIKKVTDAYLSKEDVIKQLREVATLLVKNRRDRVRHNEARWEDFCCDTRYLCEEGPEGFCQYGYHERTGHRIKEHLQRDHGLEEDRCREIIGEMKRRIDEHMKTKVASIRNGTIQL